MAVTDSSVGSPIDILKIDVEGFECQVLTGPASRLRTDRPVILFELSERTRSTFASLEGLRAALYPHHDLFEVGTRSVSGPYRLRPFDFPTTPEVLVIPAEKRTLLATMGMALPG